MNSLFGQSNEALQMRRLMSVIGTLNKYQLEAKYKLGPIATALRLVEEEFCADPSSGS